jgi:hypothetical protein
MVYTEGYARQRVAPQGKPTMLTNGVETALQTELLPGEHLLWSGQPRQGVMLRPSDAYMIPFSLLWGGFALFWEATVLMSDAPVFFGLWGAPFVLVGLYMIVGRFFAEAWLRRQTVFGLTDRRVLIVSGLWQRHLRALNLRTLADVQLSVSRNGRGTLTFGSNSHPFAPWSSIWPGSGRYAAPAFEGIEQPRAVYEQIHAAQERLHVRG